MQKLKVVFFLFSISLSYGQNLKILKPVLGSENNYSKLEYDYWRSAIDSLILSNDFEKNLSYSLMSEKTKKAIDSLETGDAPLTQTAGCSWYCGGGPYKTSASSILKNSPDYSDNNIHDFDILTAWSPNTKNGIMESISFYFEPKSPRITAIIIYNGYIKTRELWENNSRAKKIKLKINNKAIAILDLEDTTASQRFEIEPTRSEIEGVDLILTLEIMESYDGKKYKDLVISEVNFDGIDVH